jgi:hypothetical protein
MNYEYFFVKRSPKKCKVFRVYSATPEGAVALLAHELGCTATKNTDAQRFLDNLYIRPIWVETIFGEGQPWTETQHIRTPPRTARPD